MIVLGTYKAAHPSLTGPLSTELEFTMGYSPLTDSQGLQSLQHYEIVTIFCVSKIRKPRLRKSHVLQGHAGSNWQSQGSGLIHKRIYKKYRVLKWLGYILPE